MAKRNLTQVNEQLLKDFTAEQVQFSATFLEDIFRYRKSRLPDYTDPQLLLILNLIHAVASPKMKAAMLEPLQPDQQRKLMGELDDETLNHCFTHISNMMILKNMFTGLKKNKQVSLLKRLYNQDRGTYIALKDLASDSIQMVGDILVKRSEDIEALIQQDMEDLITLCQAPQKKIADAKKQAAKLEIKYDLEQQDRLLRQLIPTFYNLRIPFNNQQNFATHLKFLFVLERFIKHFPIMEKSLKTPLDQIIMQMRHFPDAEWLIKVLNQFPLTIIKILIVQLYGYERMANFEKRNIYCKLLNDLKANINLPEAGNVRFAFSQL